MKTGAENKAQFVAGAAAMDDELTAWRAAHAQASFDLFCQVFTRFARLWTKTTSITPY